MSAKPVRAALIAVPFAALIFLGGCSYDYKQHTDRVAYHTGDAVKANLEAETTNPGGKAAYRTGGLGANGAASAPDPGASAP